MCRMLGYLGTPVLLDHLLYAPDSSLLKQTVDAQMLGMLNLAGFGLAAWDAQAPDPETPLLYRSTQVAVFDRNIQALARKVRAGSVIAHLRGVPYHANIAINQESLHPFSLDGLRLVLAHNGDLSSFADMRFDLVEHIHPHFARQIATGTDSAWIHALVASALEESEEGAEGIFRAVTRALGTIRRVRERHGITRSSSVNLVLGDGKSLVATRFTFDFGRFETAPLQGGIDYLSQWYTLGRDYGLHGSEWKMIGGSERGNSVLVASEPLTRDVATWVEVPEYSALLVDRTDEGCRARLVALDP